MKFLILQIALSLFRYVTLLVAATIDPKLIDIHAESSSAQKAPSGIYRSKVHVLGRYKVVGFISSGTYGRVYKAIGQNGNTGEFAIKKFKPDKEGEMIQYTGISQSAIREMALCAELSHANVIHLVETILEDKCIFMVFEYCEHDLLQIIQHHSTTMPSAQQLSSKSSPNTPNPIPASAIKSILFQLLNGVKYLHCNWVLHRDLKPANIMVTSTGEIRIGDLGLARLFNKPLQSLYSGDKVVVTIWYRAPELLLGARHYTPAIDLWAIGCIFAELLSLRPIFKGEEAKMDAKKQMPFQRNQMQKIIDVLGMPTREQWPNLVHHPEYPQLQTLFPGAAPPPVWQNKAAPSNHNSHDNNNDNSGLKHWYYSTLQTAGYPSGLPTSSSSPSPSSPSSSTPGPQGLSLLSALLTYDPEKRLTAAQALEHPYFSADDSSGGKVSANCFEGVVDVVYPSRRVSQDDNDIRTASLPGTRRSGLPGDSFFGGAGGGGGMGMGVGAGVGVGKKRAVD